MIEEEDLPMWYPVSEIVKQSNMTRAGVLSYIRRHGIKPIRFQGQKHLYSYTVLEDILNRKQYNISGKNNAESETSNTSEIVEDKQESIAHLTAKVNLLQSQMLKVIEELNRHREILDM